jgi:acetoin utilization deacetylase AcuC-like enzyme
MKIFYTDHYVLPLPEGHRFPMAKYRMLRERVAAAGLGGPDALVEPHAATDDEILRAHDREYLRQVRSGTLSAAQQRRIGFPWTPAMVERSRRSCGATIEACRAALVDGVSVNLAGGTHHAFRDHGEGYCVFNDSAVAALCMQGKAHPGDRLRRASGGWHGRHPAP